MEELKFDSKWENGKKDSRLSRQKFKKWNR